MSHLTYSSYEGFGQRAIKTAHYQQAVYIPPGPTLQISGQGGWDRETMAISTDLEAEVNQTFANIDAALKHAGGKGISQVYRLLMFTTPQYDRSLGVLARVMRKWFPEHQPLLTSVEVAGLALEGMRVEIEASAHLG